MKFTDWHFWIEPTVAIALVIGLILWGLIDLFI
jgi:hypothetical protein